MEVCQRSSWLLLLLGAALLAAALQGVQGEAESEGPSESECRPFIEKALKELEIGEAGVTKTTSPSTDSQEDVPTVEITTDDSDHRNDGDDDDNQHDEGDASNESGHDAKQIDQIPEHENNDSQASVESVKENDHSAEDMNATSTQNKSVENESVEHKDDSEDDKESVEEKNVAEEVKSQEKLFESKEESEEEDTDNVSDKHASVEGTNDSVENAKESEEKQGKNEKDESNENVIEVKDVRSEEIKRQIKREILEEKFQETKDNSELKESKSVKIKDEESDRKEIKIEKKKKKNKWWNIDESDEKDKETVEDDSKKKKVEAWKKKNKWWHVESDEIESEEEEKKESTGKIDESVLEFRRKNKWWHIDSDEVKTDEQAKPKVEEKIIEVIVEEPKRKQNKWWNKESEEEKEESKTVKEATPSVKPTKKKNKWWNIESGEEVAEILKVEEPIAPETKHRRKNKWWRTDSEEDEYGKQIDKVAKIEVKEKIKVEDTKPSIGDDWKKKNKWWNVEVSSEDKMYVEEEIPKFKIEVEAKKEKPAEIMKVGTKIEEELVDIPLQTEKRNKWWKKSEEIREKIKTQDEFEMKFDPKIKFEPQMQFETSTSEVEDESEEDEGPAPEEDLTEDIEIPTELRPRDHVEHLLKLDKDSSGTETIIKRVAEVTLKELKKLYENAIKPLEVLYKYRDLSNRHFGDSEIFSKPLVLFMGPWSGGKSSIINYLLDNEYNATSLRTGAEPSPAYFNLLMFGKEPEVLEGTQLAADFTFSGLQKFGQGLEERLRGLKLPNKLLEKVNIVEIPGILEVRKQVSRVFPFNDACQWFIDRADIIFLVYDPSKLDVGPETEAILDQLKGREHQTRIVLNKADQVKPEELMRVQSALIWNISPLMSSPQPPAMYTTSLWSRPYENWAPARLLQAQERAFLRDLRSAIDKRIENKIASARRFAVRVRNHAKMVDCYLTTYYNHKSVFGNRKQVADQIIEHPQDYHIYEGLSTLTNISRYDLPDPDVYRDFFKLNPLYEFQQLAATCTYFRGCPINRLDVAIAYDLPELVGKHKRMVETALSGGGRAPTPVTAS